MQSLKEIKEFNRIFNGIVKNGEPYDSKGINMSRGFRLYISQKDYAIAFYINNDRFIQIILEQNHLVRVFSWSDNRMWAGSNNISSNEKYNILLSKINPKTIKTIRK